MLIDSEHGVAAMLAYAKRQHIAATNSKHAEAVDLTFLPAKMSAAGTGVGLLFSSLLKVAPIGSFAPSAIVILIAELANVRETCRRWTQAIEGRGNALKYLSEILRTRTCACRILPRCGVVRRKVLSP